VKGYKMPGGTPSNPKLAQNLPAFPANLRKQLKGANYPAPHHIMAAAVEGAKAHERLRLERHLAFLATLGSNGPFIGLFGTVLGIIKAFHDLAAGGAGGAGASTVMAGISEALVATAVGLMVAIPAVVAFNYFNRRIRVRMTELEWMAHLAAVDVRSSFGGAGYSLEGGA